MELIYALACAGVLWSICGVTAHQESANTVDQVESMSDEQKSINARTIDALYKLNSKLEEQNHIMQEQNNRIQVLENKIEIGERGHVKKTHKQGTNGLYNAHGCVSENIPLSCADGRTILVTHAEYGQYSQSCDLTCCSPHPYHCTESMSATDEDQWIYIKYLCDNRTSCSYLFEGSIFEEECAPLAAVDYVSIYYSCQPEPVDEAVGFTAYASGGSTHYDADDIILFELVISNFGGYYHTTSSQFLCPAAGMYAFGLHVLTLPSNQLRGVIMKEGSNLDGVYADDIDNILSSGSNLAITECQAGERVWVRSQLSHQGLDANEVDRFSTFTGFLLYRF